MVVDKDQDRIKQWNSIHLPVYEPGLEHIVHIARDGTRSCSLDSSDTALTLPKRAPNLIFSTDVTKCIAAADIVFLSVNTPTKASGIGAGAATDLSTFESAVTVVAQSVKSGAIIVEKSTVPCGTANAIQEIVSDSVEFELRKKDLT
jgi:UDPglucose 6-dehydrogenase